MVLDLARVATVGAAEGARIRVDLTHMSLQVVPLLALVVTLPATKGPVLAVDLSHVLGKVGLCLALVVALRATIEFEVGVEVLLPEVLGEGCFAGALVIAIWTFVGFIGYPASFRVCVVIRLGVRANIVACRENWFPVEGSFWGKLGCAERRQGFLGSVAIRKGMDLSHVLMDSCFRLELFLTHRTEKSNIELQGIPDLALVGI